MSDGEDNKKNTEKNIGDKFPPLSQKLSEDDGVSKREITVYDCLREEVNPWGVCSLSLKELAERSGYNKSTVSKSLKLLKKRGYIEIKSQYYADGGQAANQYILRYLD